MRSKLSAADLRSAESLVEVWRETQGDDGSYLLALSWVARGVRPDADDSLEIALGAAIEVEDHAGGVPPTLASLRGRPVIIYMWDKGCGDCRGQAATMSRLAVKHADKGLVVYPRTRYYATTELPREKARLDSTWAADYAKIGPTPLAISTASMERYGGSSTPTFVFIDRKGIVRVYVPYRLTEAAFDEGIAKNLR